LSGGFFNRLLVAFELIRELRRRQQPAPRVLIVSGQAAPHLDDRHPPLHQLPDPEFIDQLRKLCGIPEEVVVNEELLKLFLPVLRADFRVCETYEFRREEPLGCDIVAFGGREDPDISQCHLEAWQEQTTGSIRLALFEGGHFFVHSDEQSVVRVVSGKLEALQGRREKHYLP
jgi:surfactin synthase thioesterase subunit